MQQNTPPVLVTFFVRYESFSIVFDAIRKARPPILFLASDGPRKNHPEDRERVAMCREIAENIDWECNVYRLYSDVNLGLLKNTIQSMRFAFNIVEELVFLEDDILASQSHFKFCGELLHRYRADLRILMLCGMNHLGVYEGPGSDYFFSTRGSIWGFALWRRSFELLDFSVSYVDNPYTLKVLKENAPLDYKMLVKKSVDYRKIYLETSQECYDIELLAGVAMFLNNSMVAVSAKNMITCLGLSEFSAHAPNNPFLLPRKIRNLFGMKAYDLSLPLAHPKNICPDKSYERAVLNIMGESAFSKPKRKIEGVIRRIIYEPKSFFRMLYKKIISK